jgi:hypothetical protein
MKTLMCGLVAAVGLVSATAEVDTNVEMDFSGFTAFVPCADGGNGEEVVFQGNLHILVSVTFDAKGGFHANSHYQPQGLCGEGQSTGDEYHATGVTQEHFNGKVGSSYVYLNTFRLVGPGQNNDYIVRQALHFMVNSDGTVTMEHDRTEIDCR